jgi:hypothetical protein
MRDYRWSILAFLVIMLTSVVAGFRQCQETRLNQQVTTADQQAWDEFPAKQTERVGVSPSPAAVEAKSRGYGDERRKAPLVFDNTLRDAISQIAQAVAGVLAIACAISYVLLLRFDKRTLLSRIVNPGVPWFVAVPCNAVGGVALLLLLKPTRNLPLALSLLIPAAIALYGKAFVMWVKKR